jgi:hypothetical protein
MCASHYGEKKAGDCFLTVFGALQYFTPESMDLMKNIAYGEELGMGEVTAIPVCKPLCFPRFLLPLRHGPLLIALRLANGAHTRLHLVLRISDLHRRRKGGPK